MLATIKKNRIMFVFCLGKASGSEYEKSPSLVVELCNFVLWLSMCWVDIYPQCCLCVESIYYSLCRFVLRVGLLLLLPLFLRDDLFCCLPLPFLPLVFLLLPRFVFFRRFLPVDLLDLQPRPLYGLLELQRGLRGGGVGLDGHSWKI